MNKLFAIIAAVAALGLATTVHAAGDAKAGKTKAAVCGACHGADGNSPSDGFPKLAGQHASYLLKQLQDYKSGKRTNGIMNGQVAALSDQDMADLSAYFAGQTVTPGAASDKLLKSGTSLYRGGNPASKISACIGCHGPTGAGNSEAKFPSLSGQHAAYIAVQMKAFRNGSRSNDAGSMMQNIAAHMTDTEIEAVSSVASGLH
ncbi:MAG TPA: cytochrome c4 [Gammaproteobacteria bacterium]|nr:cytochrome c4 [Gammaproteobacteria bacterium]